ncbi:MAG: transposase family protein [Acidobacteria bacterium]|nr:transposase family protein [Acidobacteriota bacterium]
MPKYKLSDTDRQDISRGLAGLKGPRLAAEVAALASFYGVHKERIYAASRAARPGRKKRSDAGKRKVDLLGNSATRGIAEFVSNQGVSPELAAMTVQTNPHLFGDLPAISLGTVRRYLRQHGISRVQTQTQRMTYRPFEAEFPGQVYQFDISGVKERWMDIKTRRVFKAGVLDVSKNHPNRRMDRVPVWKFSLIDDKSRKKFIRFVACQKANTVHVVDFLREAFGTLGLPFILYTDNDSIIVNKRTRRGADFLNQAFADSGGFRMLQHEPGRPQATGKVERMHQSIEEYEKLIGIKVEFGNAPTIEKLNTLADLICQRDNSRTHRSTGIAPNVAFRATTNPFRKIDPDQFDAAFKARDLLLRIHPDITISVDGVRYQLSRKAEFPFQELAVARQKIEVYWVDDDDFFACVTPAGDQYTIQKVVAVADTVGVQKSLPETRGKTTRKALKASQKERVAALKAETRAAGSVPLIVPGLDTEIAEAERGEKILDFPRRIETGDTDRLNELTHFLSEPGAAAAGLLDRSIDLFDALELLQRDGRAPSEPCAELTEIKSRLVEIFAGETFITEADLETAFNNPKPAADQRLAAVS